MRAVVEFELRDERTQLSVKVVLCQATLPDGSSAQLAFGGTGTDPRIYVRMPGASAVLRAEDLLNAVLRSSLSDEPQLEPLVEPSSGVPRGLRDLPSGGVGDSHALDRLADLLAVEEWPGASGMEDVAEIVASTGRDVETPRPGVTWPRH